MKQPAYRNGYPPVTVYSKDGRTAVKVHKRADGKWQWTKYRSGRKVGTEGQSQPRCRAIGQAFREAGEYATITVEA